MNRYRSDKRIATLIRDLEQQGWRWLHRGKHARLVPPDGRPFVTLPLTPSCYRAYDNIRAEVLRVMRMPVDSGGHRRHPQRNAQAPGSGPASAPA